MWTLDFWHHEDRTPTHGYAATREAAMAAFAVVNFQNRRFMTDRKPPAVINRAERHATG
jgi:hypothetical protein